MAGNRSFTEYVKNHFEDELYETVKNHLSDTAPSTLDLRLWRISSIGEIELSETEIRFVSVSDLPDTRIAFDVVIDATLTVYDADHYHNDKSEEKHQWFLCHCNGDLACGLSDMTVSGIDIYSGRNKQVNPLSDALVPVTSHERLEDDATDFLRRNYPEALEHPMAIDPKVLTERMGLSICLRRITEDCTVFGEIVFEDANTELYDEEANQTVYEEIPGQTIIVDPQSYYLRNLGSVNNTIIHECIHWDRHRKAFMLERLYNNEATQIRCQVAGGIQNSGARSATDWMEWQANALAPRIQMPLGPFKQKAHEIIRRYRKETGITELVDIMEFVIDELAAFFCVSRCAAKIRMVDAGFDEAIGVFTYVDDHYVRPHSFRKNAIRKNQTYSIGIKDAMIESVISPQFDTKLKSGNYLFVDSHVCLNTPKFITTDESGKSVLTDYARHHIDECCLIFDLNVRSVSKYGEKYFTECVLYRDAASGIIFEAHYSKDNQDSFEQITEIRKYNDELKSVASNLPVTFSGTLDALIIWSGMTEEELAEAADMSQKTIQRLRNREPDNVSVETVIQLCIGMNLPPMLSDCLLKASGNKLMYTDQHIMYRFLLQGCYTKTIFECNDMLIAQELKPLGRQNRKNNF